MTALWGAGLTAEIRQTKARTSRVRISRGGVSVAVGRNARGRELEIVRAALIARAGLVADLDRSWHGQIGHGDSEHPRFRFHLSNCGKTEHRDIAVPYKQIRKFTKRIPVRGLKAAS